MGSDSGVVGVDDDAVAAETIFVRSIFITGAAISKLKAVLPDVPPDPESESVVVIGI